MKIIILIFSALLIFSAPTLAQEKTETKTEAKKEFTLIIETEDGNRRTFALNDLSKLPRREIKAKDHDAEAVFSGYDLREVLKLAGAKIGNNQLRGRELANFLLVEAADGYKAVFALTELDSDFTDKIVLLSDARDGKAPSEKEGVLRLVVPDEKKHGRWVRQVVALKIRKAQ